MKLPYKSNVKLLRNKNNLGRNPLQFVGFFLFLFFSNAVALKYFSYLYLLNAF